VFESNYSKEEDESSLKDLKEMNIESKDLENAEKIYNENIIEAYLKKIGKIPILSREKEIEL
jgi:hypothetical protein